MLEVIVQYKVFFAVMIAAVLSQGIKVTKHAIEDKRRFRLSDLIITGGMPSTHSAIVSSLFAILLLDEGVSKTTVVAIVLFMIVITDSMGVRRTAGEEAVVVNKIIREEKMRIHRIHFSMGHMPIEVLAGIAIGFFVSVSMWLLI